MVYNMDIKKELRSLDARLSALSIADMVSLFALLLGVLLRAGRYWSNRSLWLDEASLANGIIESSWAALLHPLMGNQQAPLGFVYVEKIISVLWNGGEHALRLFPLLAGVAGLVLFYRIASGFCGGWAKATAVSLFAFSESLIYFSAEVKQYSSDVLVALCLIGLMQRYRALRPSLPAAISLGLAGALCLLFSHPALFMLVGLGCVLLGEGIYKKDWRAVAYAGLSAGLWAVVFAVTYWLLLRWTAGNTELNEYWRDGFMAWPPKTINDLFWPVKACFGIFSDPLGIVHGEMAVIPVLAGMAALFAKRRIPELAMLLIPLAAALGVALAGVYPFKGRLIVFVLPAIFLLAGCGLSLVLENLGRFRQFFGVSALLVLAAPSFQMALASYRIPPKREELRPVMEYIKKNQRKNDLIYLYYGAQPAFRYYAPRFGFVYVKAIEGVCSRSDEKAYFKQLDALQNKGRLWFVCSHAYSGEEDALLKHLDGLGRRLASYRAMGALCILFDLNKGTTL
ncbi:MAG: hypothetical protein PHC61_09150 [Chitinivibrionales bacterium]|nr:hypothetical protein [Chitinivibrionales bacterium]